MRFGRLLLLGLTVLVGIAAKEPSGARKGEGAKYFREQYLVRPVRKLNSADGALPVRVQTNLGTSNRTESRRLMFSLPSPCLLF